MRRDPGLGKERTRLAWRRTALAMTAVTLLTVRLALSRHAPLLVAAALGGWVAAVAVATRRIPALTASQPDPAGRVPPLIALTIVGYAAVGVLLVLTSLG